MDAHDAYEMYGIADRALDRAIAAENRAKELEKELEEVAAKGRRLVSELTGCAACWTHPCSPECPVPASIDEFGRALAAVAKHKGGGGS